MAKHYLVKCESAYEWDFVREYYNVSTKKVDFDCMPNRQKYLIVDHFHKDNNGKYASSEWNNGTDISFKQFCELKNINIMKYKEGDIIIGNDRGKRKILGVCGLAYIPSQQHDFNTAGATRTQYELDDLGYSLFEEPKEVILTMEEVAKLAGVSVENLKIKK